MKLPLSELIDRYSIELRKDYYGHGNPALVKDLADSIKEHIGKRTLNMLPEEVFAIMHAGVTLGLRNADIANCEWQIRAGDKRLSLEEVGRRALLTRRINDDRSKAKTTLSIALGETVEPRHFGFGDGINYDGITLDVQEPPVPVLPEAFVSALENEARLSKEPRMDR